MANPKNPEKNVGEITGELSYATTASEIQEAVAGRLTEGVVKVEAVSEKLQTYTEKANKLSAKKSRLERDLKVESDAAVIAITRRLGIDDDEEIIKAIARARGHDKEIADSTAEKLSKMHELSAEGNVPYAIVGTYESGEYGLASVHIGLLKPGEPKLEPNTSPNYFVQGERADLQLYMSSPKFFISADDKKTGVSRVSEESRQLRAEYPLNLRDPAIVTDGYDYHRHVAAYSGAILPFQRAVQERMGKQLKPTTALVVGKEQVAELLSDITNSPQMLSDNRLEFIAVASELGFEEQKIKFIDRWDADNQFDINSFNVYTYKSKLEGSFKAWFKSNIANKNDKDVAENAESWDGKNDFVFSKALAATIGVREEDLATVVEQTLTVPDIYRKITALSDRDLKAFNASGINEVRLQQIIDNFFKFFDMKTPSSLRGSDLIDEDLWAEMVANADDALSASIDITTDKTYRKEIKAARKRLKQTAKKRFE